MVATGGNAAPPGRMARQQLRLWVSVVVVVLAVPVTLYLLIRTP